MNLRFGMRWRLMLTYILLIAFILFVITVYLHRTLKSHYLVLTRDRLQREAALAERCLLDATSELSFTYDIDTVADEIGERLSLRITVVDPSGTVRGDSELDGQDLANVENHAHRPEIQQALGQGIGMSIRHSYTISADMMYLATPVEREGEVVGVVRLALPLSEIDQTLLRVREILGVALGIGLILAVFLSYVTARAVTRPLKDMSRIAERMAKGEFSRKVTGRSRGEIGQLGTTLNRMAFQLSRTIEEISSERDRLRAVLGGMREGVMMTDGEGRILLTNAAFKNIFPITSSVEGKTVIETVRDAKLHGAVEKALRSGREVIEEIELVVPMERVFYVHVVPLGEAPDSTGTVVVLYDVTRLKKLEKVRKDFVANVSHELNTPLTAIKGYAETLLDKALDDNVKAEKFLKIILRHVDRMSQLVADLLALSQLESETYEPSLSPQKVQRVAGGVSEALKDATEKKNLTLTVDLPADLPPVMGDERGLAQVLLNLLDNAVKFTPDGGSIAVRAQEMEGTIQVSVSDTGIGIPLTDVPRIFERFYRVNKDRSRDLGGTGLGLSIVKHIVQAHGGHVWVESQVGQGSTFFFTLPKA